MKKLLVFLCIFFALICLPGSSFASHTPVGGLFTSTLLGATVGMVLGAATLPFSHSDHPEDRIFGGLIIGTALGFGLGVWGIAAAPSYTETQTAEGNRERIYGLSFRIPLGSGAPAAGDEKTTLLHP